MKQHSWREYFYFSSNERGGVIILFILMSAFFLLPVLFPYKEKPVVVNEKLQQQIALLQQNNADTNSSTIDDSLANKNFLVKTPIKAKDSLFYFDPNALDENGWKLLGVRDKTIQTIIHYRNVGAKFYKPEDIRKIYGLYKEKADELIPFIKIKNQEKSPYKKEYTKKDSAAASQTYHHKTFSYININTATADEFKTLPGIGEVLSARIVKFRASIGGFKSVDDVARTYGLRDSVFKMLRPYLILK